MTKSNAEPNAARNPNSGRNRFAAVVMAAACALAGLLMSSNAAGAADQDRGKGIFERRCTGCHSLDQDKEGPRLRGVYGRVSGTVPTFTYSDGIKNAQITWDTVSLDKWLAGPDDFIAGADMAFRLPKPDERAAIIDYLKQLSRK